MSCLILERLRQCVHLNVPRLLEPHGLDEDRLRQSRHEFAEGDELWSVFGAFLKGEGRRKIDNFQRYQVS